MEAFPKNTFYGMTLDEEQAAFVAAIKDLSKTIVFCDAPAGTGKTTLAMGAANILVQDKRNELEGIVYIVSPYGEQKQGQERCAVCKLTTNHRGWLSTYADALEE